MKKITIVFLATLLLAGCDKFGAGVSDTPLTNERTRQAERGKLTGDDGWDLLGGSNQDKESGARLGVNSFLWRATLDTISFMPFLSADPFGGTIITDWYEAPDTPGERFKVNALILDSSLRADAVKITLFKQAVSEKGVWRDIKVNPELGRKLENTILTRARELRVNRIMNES